jgi:hypothetical protein
MRMVFAAGVVLAALATPVASAKDGAQAHLLAPLPAHAHAGALITVRWTVTVTDAHGAQTPFGAIGMFANIVGAHHVTTSATATQSHAPFSVRISVPAGGIHAIKLGLHGFASGPAGTRPAPVFFPIT